MKKKSLSTLQMALLGLVIALPQASIYAATQTKSAPVPAVAAEMKPVLVSSIAELEKAVASAPAGSTFLLADGTYNNAFFTLKGMGTEAKPITISAQTPGKVRFTGESGVTIDGEWLVFSGFVFTDGNPKAAPSRQSVVEAIMLQGKHNRVTEVAMIDFSKNYISPPDVKEKEVGYHKWVGIRGQYNRVDHSVFKGKKGGGTLMVVWRDTDQADYHRIDHNQFLDVAYGLDQNGHETLRIGTSDQSQSDSKSVIEYNYFENCDGEVEVISNKSGGNIYRNNTFKNVGGALTLRHGKGTLIENNVFLQGGKKPDPGIQSAGIRITDKNHIIRNNYFEGVSAFDNATGGIAILAHNINPPLNDYWEVDNVTIENNTIVNSTNTLLFGGARAKQAPTGVNFVNNIFCSNLDGDRDGPLVTLRPKQGESKFTYKNNTFCAKDLGVDKALLGADSVFSKEGIEKVGAFWVSKDPSKGFRPIKMTTKEETGPRTYQP